VRSEFSQSEEYEVGVRWPPAWELVVGQSPVGKNVNTEAEDNVGIRQRLVKTAD
jgi:hypothetical protein